MPLTPSAQVWQKALSIKLSRWLLATSSALAVALPLSGWEATAAVTQTPILNVTGTLESGDAVFPDDATFYDLYSFEGQAGQAVLITLESPELDTYLLLRDSQGKILFQNDDTDDGNTNSSIAVVLPTTGTYQVIANSFATQGKGSYHLTVTPLRPDDPLVRKFEADELIRKGRALDNQGQYQEALESYLRSLAIRQAIGDRSGEGQSLSNIGLTYNNLGDYAKALDYYQQSLAIFQEVGNKRGAANSLNNIGATYNNLGNYSQALGYYQQSLAIFQEVGNRRGEGTSLSNVGATYDSLGEYSKALDYYQQSLSIFQEIGDQRGQGNSLNNIGTIYDALGNYPKALDYYQQTLSIWQTLGDKSAEGTALNNIGGIHESLGEYAKALDYYQQSLAIQHSIGDKRNEGIALNNIGFIYTRLGEVTKALDYYQQNLTLQQAIGNQSGEGLALNNIGFIYSQLKDYAKALNYYQQSWVVYQATRDRAGEARSLNNIGAVLAKQNQPELAIVFLKQSVNLYEAIRGDLHSLDQSLQSSYTDTVADTYRYLADLLLQQDRVLEAQRVLDLLKVQEIDGYLQDVRGNDDTEQGIATRPAETQIESSLNARTTEVVALAQELRTLEAIPPNQLTAQQQQRLVDLGKQTQQLIAGFNTFLQSQPVQAQVARLRQTTDGQSIDLSNFQTLQRNLDALHQNAVLLYPFVLDDRLELVLVTPKADTPIRITVPVDRVTLNRAIADYRSALKHPSSNPLPLAQQLYDWLLKPLERDLKAIGAKTIIYAPDGQLRYIPLAALHDGQKWVVQNYRINNITAASLTDLTLLPTQTPRVFAGAFTEGSYPVQVGDRQTTLYGLQYAGKEIADVATLMPNTSEFLNAAFNPDTVYSMNSYSIVHLATHAAFVPGDKSKSFILFGDGTPVSLAEVQNWRLPNVDLIVLSACETGVGDELGDGREVLGLGYQMQKAGAKAAVASLWSVSDGGTEALMDAFYGALTEGMSKAEALQQAQIALITGDFSAVGEKRGSVEVVSTLTHQRLTPGGSLAHPYYWAPFILLGNGL